MDELLLALDFGGTKHTAAVALLGSTRWLNHRRASSPDNPTAEDDLKIIAGLARQVLGDHKPAAIGVSFGGPVEFSTGLVRLSHHVPGWEDFPLGVWLSDTFDAPAAIDNDANAAALGEWRFGNGGMADSLLYVTVSTGVGGGWILNGRPWRGHQSLAGEIGHTVVDPDGPLCLCGKRGCVERLASGPYMAQDATALLKADPGRGEVLWRLAGADEGRIDARMLAAAAAKGDPVARQILLRGARSLGVGLGNAVNLINPERLLLGGGVAKSGELFWVELRETLRRVSLPEMRYELLPARYLDDAPLWGALTLAADLLER